MVRSAVVIGIILSLLPAQAWGGQASARFKVGITIGGTGNSLTRHLQKPGRTYSWGAAAISVRRAGFAGVQRAGRSGRLYWFEASRSGSSYRIAVSVSSGAIMKVMPA